jgi:hypothetical protein
MVSGRLEAAAKFAMKRDDTPFGSGHSPGGDATSGRLTPSRQSEFKALLEKLTRAHKANVS